MKFLKHVLAGAMALACVTPAWAADNTVTAKMADGTTTVTFCGKDVGAGVMASCASVVDTSGTKIDPMTKTGGTVGIVAGTAVIGHVIVDTAPTTAVTGTVTANAGTNLNTSSLALDSTLAAQSAKLPAALGSTTKAGSLSVTYASDQTLPAGELHLGEVGGNVIPITVAQTVTASSAYTSGNAVGGLITLANAVRVSGSLGASGTSGLIQDVAVNMKSAQTGQIDLFFFKANPSGSTCTDKTAFVLATADFDKVIGVAHIVDWTAGNVASVGQLSNYAKFFGLSSATSLYACAVTRSTPTFTATSDLSLTVTVNRN